MPNEFADFALARPIYIQKCRATAVGGAIPIETRSSGFRHLVWIGGRRCRVKAMELAGIRG